ncbi:hypothetical protein T439DRAFT_325146 [Meredithblackwellia eburnea MCA 4105]
MYIIFVYVALAVDEATRAHTYFQTGRLIPSIQDALEEANNQAAAQGSGSSSSGEEEQRSLGQRRHSTQSRRLRIEGQRHTAATPGSSTQLHLDGEENVGLGREIGSRYFPRSRWLR